MKDSKQKHSGSTTPFQRFEELTKRLLSVPKKEADAKAAKRKRDKDKTR